ncbi:hypothetical protein BHE74_00041607 [Ensete ventricosum]|uniref:Uncharacterized protein n=1 Tax=Ensete ventricosum TaxID=4639 RepID=A0A444F7J2_ENSVE|nr:hypothetical protein GW17_00017390 [Ensete ventricosum]RWW51998.1 hypothetical protein BHE74_00041607 [Ensete ventricosum]RZR75059.1 hypothetical protein BHM03_00048721 [Ensete ventricosum]
MVRPRSSAVGERRGEKISLSEEAFVTPQRDEATCGIIREDSSCHNDSEASGSDESLERNCRSVIVVMMHKSGREYCRSMLTFYDRERSWQADHQRCGRSFSPSPREVEFRQPTCVKKLKIVMAKHGTERCSLGLAKLAREEEQRQFGADQVTTGAICTDHNVRLP